jgi:hypothetical protein
MNFFKSVFSDEQDEEEHSENSPKSPSSDPEPTAEDPNPNIASIATAWSFGSSLIKNLASRSESVIETYRRDLEEFGTGLKKETAVIREAASRAVKDLPSSLEAGASAAQESLESVGHVIDNIITQGKESLLAGESDSEASDSKSVSNSNSQLDLSSKPYSRLEVQIRSIQSDMNTYCEEPDDLDEFNEWKLGFVLDEMVEEIEDKGVIEEIYKEIVPVKVDRETFWSRYFYRVYKAKKAEETRTKLVNRAISGDQEEELTWDVDDDDYEENDGSKVESQVQETETEIETEKKDELNKENVNEEKKVDEAESSSENVEVKSDDKLNVEAKNDNGGSSKDSDFSVVSSQHSPEEDLGWDEIEDIGSGDENNKAEPRGSLNTADLHRRLSAPEKEEEEIAWDIEDDDEPIQSRS